MKCIMGWAIDMPNDGSEWSKTELSKTLAKSVFSKNLLGNVAERGGRGL